MKSSFWFEESIDTFLVEQFSADGLCNEKARKNLEQEYAKYLEVTDKFNRKNVSYQLSKKDVLHSWLKYKEGFSADLVNMLLDEMGAHKGDLVMDPFFGSGTTGLVCQMRGINSIGYDIMPISSVAVKAKSAVLDYNIQEIINLFHDVEELNIPEGYIGKTEYIKITQDAYPERTELFLQYIKEWNENNLYSDNAKNLLKLCILNSLERCSYTNKSGQYLSWDCRSKKVIEANIKRAEKGQKLLSKKYVRSEIGNIKETVIEELAHMLNDIKTIQENSLESNDAQINYMEKSVLYEIPKLKEGILKGVITSPPYCNRYDYTRTYALELVYLGFGEDDIKKMRQDLLSCTVESRSKMDNIEKFYKSIDQADRFKYIKEKIESNMVLKEIVEALNKRKDNGDLNNNGVVRMVEGYFTELGFIFAELFRLCQKGAMVAFVNDNVRYGGEVIPVDFLSSSLAEDFGFKIKKIYTLKQQKGNSSQQMAKFGKIALRKGITIWIKE
ncbi:MAG: site-specific DNA-methyltransferase [Lachnospiraceae bacterium]|nr:site-specific DNA-methyltransferase [Lachnospiraceae bacterium]